MADGKTGSATVPIIDPAKNTEVGKTAPVVSTYTFPGPNLTPSETWTSGHRTPYGLAFAPDGRLWELEHGPRGGDELNLIEPGKNYGWPLVGEAPNYDGVPVPGPDTRPDLTQPVLNWTPVIAHKILVFLQGGHVPAVERQCPDRRHGHQDPQSPRSILARGARPSRGGSRWEVTASATWKWARTAPCGCWRTPTPAACSA